MKEYPNLYIGGQWVSPHSDNMSTVINPSTEEVCAKIASGDKADVDAAVRAAREAFDSFSQSSRESRVKLLRDVVAGIQSRADEFAEAINQEMGAPLWWAQQAQVPAGIAHFATAADVLEKFKFVEAKGTTHLRREAIGVCGMITPWNWPLNQVACKIAAALAVGCTVVLKPAEQTPLDSILLAEVIDAAGAPPGVFNLVTGSGSVVGSALSDHPEVDMVSFTGSTRAGAMVAKAAADSIKRVSQELGGKSVNLVLPDADLQESVVRAVRSLMSNAGQTCSAGSRLLVPADRQEEAIAIAKQTAESIPVALSADADAPAIGPISTQRQYEQVKKLIGVGIDEGATLVTGGVESPSGATKGFFVKPTIFANVNNAMAIAQEEIFGPVLVIIAYEDVDQAVQIANDSPYGLSGYVQGPHEQAVEVASRIRTGQVFINNAHADFNAPFGGFKQSGNGREWGEVGFDEFLEYKAVLGAEVGA